MFTINTTMYVRLLYNFDKCIFNNILAKSWWSVLLVGETTDLPQVTDNLYHIMLYTSPRAGFELTTLVVIGTDCTGSCKSNYHTITTKTATNIVFWMYDCGGITRYETYTWKFYDCYHYIYTQKKHSGLWKKRKILLYLIQLGIVVSPPSLDWNWH